ncbi:MAG: DUF4238 domain-containing protein [Candidatus Poribacteria bacterium]|nr:DUF4238 domain-containing protein [Candidatus Poribacteria bacterium]
MSQLTVNATFTNLFYHAQASMKGIRTHYVPKFYLKNFGDRIYQYDKQTGKVRQSTPDNVAFQRDFYVDSNNNATLKLEGAMSQIEGNASTVISDIIGNGSIIGLSDICRAKLCQFVALQFARTPEFREWRHDMMQNMLDRISEQLGVTDWHIVEKEEHAKLIHLAAMLDYVDRIGPNFIRMGFRLLKNDTPIPLWASDNPVVRHNDLTDKLGAGSPGVQFYLPLTPKLLLQFYDSTSIDLIDNAARSAGIPKEYLVREHNKVLEADSMEMANVIHANHLQTIFSTRFIFTNRPRFHMMKAFLDVNRNCRNWHIFQAGDMDGQIHQDGPVVNGDGWECRDVSTISGIDALYHNLQNALWRYRDAIRETDMHRALVGLYESLEMATNLSWVGDQSEEEFDDKVRKLMGVPELPIGELRRLYNYVKSSKYLDQYADRSHMAKQVDVLRQITATVLFCRLHELRIRGQRIGGLE